jgi:uncharacterized protein (TIGR02246 family)
MSDDDRARGEIVELLDSTVRAWGAGDAEAFGAAFATEASYVTFVGTVYSGRTEIVESHRALFAEFLKGTRLVYEILAMHVVQPDVLVVVTRGDVVKGARSKSPTKVQTYTVTREPTGVWRIAAFQNTKRRRLLEWFQFTSAPATKPSAQH